MEAETLYFAPAPLDLRCLWELTPEELIAKLPGLTRAEAETRIKRSKDVRDAAILANRCPYCGVEGHTEDTCTARETENRELTKEYQRRLQRYQKQVGK